MIKRTKKSRNLSSQLTSKYGDVFIALFKDTDGYWTVKPFKDFTVDDHAALAEQDGQNLWVPYFVYRADERILLCDMRQERVALEIRRPPEELNALTDTEVVLLFEAEVINDANAIYFLAQDFNRNGNSNWSTKFLEDKFGKEALRSLMKYGYLVSGSEGAVSLARAGAEALSGIGLSRSDMKSLAFSNS